MKYDFRGQRSLCTQIITVISVQLHFKLSNFFYSSLTKNCLWLGLFVLPFAGGDQIFGALTQNLFSLYLTADAKFVLVTFILQ